MSWEKIVRPVFIRHSLRKGLVKSYAQNEIVPVHFFSQFPE